MENQQSSFTKGIYKDLNPVSQPEGTLTDVINGTTLTYDGNENVLQNDMGNTSLQYNYGDGESEPVQLTPGFVPIGVKEYGNILYITSARQSGCDDDGNKIVDFEIGSFPSPDYRNTIQKPEQVVLSSVGDLDSNTKLFGEDEQEDVIYNKELVFDYMFNMINPMLISKGKFRSLKKYKIINKDDGRDVTSLLGRLDFLNNKLVITHRTYIGGNDGVLKTVKFHFTDGTEFTVRPNKATNIENYKKHMNRFVYNKDGHYVNCSTIYNLTYDIPSDDENRGCAIYEVIVVDLLEEDNIDIKIGNKKIKYNSETKLIDNVVTEDKLKWYDDDEIHYFYGGSKSFYSNISQPCRPIISFYDENIDDVHIALIKDGEEQHYPDINEIDWINDLQDQKDITDSTGVVIKKDGVISNEYISYSCKSIKLCDLFVQSDSLIKCSEIEVSCTVTSNSNKHADYYYNLSNGNQLQSNESVTIKSNGEKVIIDGKEYYHFTFSELDLRQLDGEIKIPRIGEDIYNSTIRLRIELKDPYYGVTLNPSVILLEYDLTKNLNTNGAALVFEYLNEPYFGISNSFYKGLNEEPKSLFDQLTVLNSSGNTGFQQAKLFVLNDEQVVVTKPINAKVECEILHYDYFKLRSKEKHDYVLNAKKVNIDAKELISARYVFGDYISKFEAKPCVYMYNNAAVYYQGQMHNAANSDGYCWYTTYNPENLLSIGDKVYGLDLMDNNNIVALTRCNPIYGDYYFIDTKTLESDKGSKAYNYALNKEKHKVSHIYHRKIKRNTTNDDEKTYRLNRLDWPTNTEYLKQLGADEIYNHIISEGFSNTVKLLDDDVDGNFQKVVVKGISMSYKSNGDYVDLAKDVPIQSRDSIEYGFKDLIGLSNMTVKDYGFISNIDGKYIDINCNGNNTQEKHLDWILPLLTPSIVVVNDQKEDVKSIEFDSDKLSDENQNVGKLWFNQVIEKEPCDLLRYSIKTFSDADFVVPQTKSDYTEGGYRILYHPVYSRNDGDGYNYYSPNKKIDFNVSSGRYALQFYIEVNNTLKYTAVMTGVDGNSVTYQYSNKKLDNASEQYLYDNAIKCNLTGIGTYITGLSSLTIKTPKSSGLTSKLNNLINGGALTMFTKNNIKSDAKYIRCCIIFTANSAVSFYCNSVVRNPILTPITNEMLIKDLNGEVGCWLLSGQGMSDLRVGGYPFIMDGDAMESCNDKNNKDFCHIDYIPLPYYEINNIID